jgi:phosphoribosylformylglycinamidine cyclo-ligase
MTTTYKDAGVDVDAGNRAVSLISSLAEGTHVYARGSVLSGIGGFPGAIERPNGEILGFATDGVGTKLMLAAIMEKHDTIGIDLVAMCVNDLIALGIEPWVFLDYIAMGNQDPERTKAILKGIVLGCHLAHTALIGGEMAELPGMYDVYHYDLAGFAVGFASHKRNLITGKDIRPGMKVYGLPSSGVHSNGFSLIRKIFNVCLGSQYERQQAVLGGYYPPIKGSLGEELLKPTVIYIDAVKKLLRRYRISGMAHITGGGLVENPPRMLPDGCAVILSQGRWKVPPIFELIQERGEISGEEMLRVFNMGIGFVIVSPDEIDEDGVIPIGRVIEGPEKKVFFE